MSESTGHRRQLSEGHWYAVLGDRVSLVLPAAERPRVAGLWELVDGGADFDEVLDGLLAGGIRTLTGFVLVGHGDSTRVLVRGGATVTLVTGDADADLTVSGAGEAMWADRSVRGVTGGAVVLEDAGPTDLALTSGIARVGSLLFGDSVSVDGAVATPPAPEALALPVADRDEVADTGPDTQDDPAARPEPLPAEPVRDSDPGDDEADPEADPEPVADVVPIEAAASSDTDAREPLTFGAPTDDDATPTGEQHLVVDDEADDHDGQTTVGPATDGFVRPGVPGQELAPSVVSRPVAKLVLSTGEVVEVDRAIVVGRAPEARRLASSDQPQLLTVASPNHEISSTHLEIRPGAGADHGSAVVTDLGSTNGTVLVQPGLPPEDLQAGIAVSLIPGAILDLGDGVTIQTTNP